MTETVSSPAPLLSVTDLRVRLDTARGPAEALRGVDLQLERGATLGLIGESGCGKSMTAMAVMGLLPAGAVVTGSIKLNGQELVGLGDAAIDRKSTRLNSSHLDLSRMPSSA